jgi:hypothetical protein
MVAIKIYNSAGQWIWLDLMPDTIVSIEETMPAFDRDLEVGIFSLPVEIPMTARNRTFLGFPESFSTSPSALLENWRVDVYADHVLHLQDGNMKLINHVGRLDDLHGSYQFNITGSKSIYGKKIKGKTLRDLALGGSISWSLGLDCRSFAQRVMTDPTYGEYKDRFTFPPVVMEDYFDTTRDDYNNELLTLNTVNSVVFNPAFTVGWLYGVEKVGVPGAVVTSGNADYEHHRTVPFFNLVYVLKQCFAEFGVQLSGSFLTMPDVAKLTIFNNCSLEKYDPNFPQETGRMLVPSNHVPDIGIYEFIRRICNAFNLKLVFLNNQQAQLNFCESALNFAEQYKNFTSNVIVDYTGAERNAMYENGYTLSFEPDGADAYWSDRVKDMKDYEIVASVNAFADIAGLTLATPNSSHFIYIKNENYYYNYNEITTKWEPFSEALWEMKSGKGETMFNAGFAPMCEHYDVDAGGVWSKQRKVAARMTGSYFNSKYKLVRNEFGLRLFYVREETTVSYTNLPRSFSHNREPDGIKLATISLSWTHPESLYQIRFKQWINMLIQSWNVQAQFQLSTPELLGLNEQDVIVVKQYQFVIQNIDYDLPLRNPISASLIKL